ncbi:MAG: hypothetical protein D4R64_04705, partial [Porphyromonadaceae bacterium]
MKKSLNFPVRISQFLFFLHFFLSVDAQEPVPPAYLHTDSLWVDSVYNSLSPRERIGQLIMVAAFSNRGPEQQAEIERLIRDAGIGGIAFFQGGPVRQSGLVNRYQSISKVPILMAIDAEWGLAMRLDSTPTFPYQIALGAIRDNEIIYRMGAEIGRELTEIGIQMNFAPVVDVNSNPNNPVINYRSFGENPTLVAAKGRAYMNGLQDMHILATAKHFPGHGDTESDSHNTLPEIKHSASRLNSVELLPFRNAIQEGVTGIMTAHLHIPSLDPTPDLASSLSEKIVTGLLKEEMGFKGLIVTDALDMQAADGYHSPGELEALAFQAGNDILLI